MDKLELIKYDLYAQDLRRIKHIEGVAESAIEIKNRHFPFITDETALCAAYMHDFTKEYSKEQFYFPYLKNNERGIRSQVALVTCGARGSYLKNNIIAF